MKDLYSSNSASFSVRLLLQAVRLEVLLGRGSIAGRPVVLCNMKDKHGFRPAVRYLEFFRAAGKSSAAMISSAP